MALTATLYRIRIALSDVERGVYESIDLRAAQHPSETLRHLIARVIGYCLCYQDGIAFAKGGVSSVDEPAIVVREGDGRIRAWIEIGAPSAERLHRAAKLADVVTVFTFQGLEWARKESASRAIHRAAEISLFSISPVFLDGIADRSDRNMEWELTRSDGHLYLNFGGVSVDTELARTSMADF